MKVFIGVDDAGLLGPLTKPFLFDAPLAPLQAQIELGIAGTGVFDFADLCFLHLMARLNRRDRQGMLVPDGVRPDASWRRDGANAYCAEFDFNLAELLRKDRKRDGAKLLPDALSRLRELSVQATAQAAVELGADRERIEAFVAAFPDVPVSLLPGRKTRKTARKAVTLLDVEVRHEGGLASDILKRRAQLREALEGALRESKLGRFDGGSSGEFHYEFGFAVSDVDAAIEVMRETLRNAGVPAEHIGFEVMGSQS